MIRVPASLAVILILALVTPPVPAAVHDMADSEADYSKIIVVILGIYEKGAFEESATVRYGHAPNIGHQEGNFTAVVRAGNGTPLMHFSVWDPRSQVEVYGLRNELERHEQTEDPSLEEKYLINGTAFEDVDLPIIIPYQPDIRYIDLVDRNSGTVMTSVNITPALSAFHHRFPQDPDMTAYPPCLLESGFPDLAGLSFYGVSGVFALGILAVLIRLIRKP